MIRPLHHPTHYIILRMITKPFIIRQKGLGQPLIEPTSSAYNETQEGRVQVLQAANGYLAVPSC